MPFQNNVLAGASGATGYEIPYSLRFRRANNAAMTRTAGTPTNAKIATWSFWHKRGALGPEWVWGESTGGASTFFTFDSSAPDTIRIQVRGANLTSTPVFRDPSAWYHFVVAVDTTQATAADRIKVYANNQAVTMSGTITLNADITFNESGKSIKISNGAGWFATSADYIDGYLAEFNFIDGQALTPSSFGQTDSATGVWVPKAYAGTYGTNGFYLKFADASAATAAAIGKDSSGNGNNWTPSGISVTSGTTFDQMLDTPTLNYATLTPLIPLPSSVLRYANLEFNANTTSFHRSAAASFSIPTTGKWYWEVTACTNSGGSGNNEIIGVADISLNPQLPASGIEIGKRSGSDYGYRSDATKWSNNVSASYGATYTNGNVIGVAWDSDAGTLAFYKNGVSQGTAYSSITQVQGKFAPASSNAESSGWDIYNFGQRAFAYTPPTGFKALNTANLPTPSIKKGSLYMDATLRTGTGATASVSSLGFQPDLVWIKSRSAATDHGLYDAVRGVQKQLESNTITAETTETTGLTAFNSNGYTVGALAQLNTNAATYVDWAWKEGVTPGFDIVSYAGDNVAGRTISHALGSTPAMMVLKSRSNARTWAVYHKNLTSAAYYLGLETTNGQLVDNTMFNSTAPTSSVFSVGTYQNTSGENYIAYLWSEIEGFSKFGSYTGNGSTDGPFVWCGFRPRWIMIKRTDSANSWPIFDTARNITNVANAVVAADQATAESSFGSTDQLTDILSNGFKLKTSTSGMINASGGTYIFAAFSENPFKYARAR